MADEAPPLTRDDIEAKIVERCWQDEAFRQEFTADPAGTAVKYLEVPAASSPTPTSKRSRAGRRRRLYPSSSG
jgi:hypothetical protein